MSLKINKKVKLAVAGFFTFFILAFSYLSYLNKLHKEAMEKFSSYEVFEKQSYYGDNWFYKITSRKRVDAIFVGDDKIVSSLEGFEDLRNLESLSFIDHPSINLNPIKNNRSLKTLILQNTEISDISCIKGLTNLEILSLEGTNVKDLSPLEKLTKLKVLYINKTVVSDISILSHLKNLEVLDLSETLVSDISSLKDLKRLHSLKVQFSSIRNFESIRGRPFYDLLIDESQLKNVNISSSSNILVHEGIDPEDLEQKGRGHFKYPRFWRYINRMPQMLRRGREYLESNKK